MGWKDKIRQGYNAAAKAGKAVVDDAKLQAADTLSTLGTLVNDNTPEGEKPKDLTLTERAKIARGHLSKTEWLKVAKDTAQDLTKKDELKRLAGTVIALPGGLAVYGAYRVAKHHKDKAEEEKLQAAKAAAKKPRKPKAPKA
ncbi:MAG TPA: hypothetical protein VEF76_14335 [Patescibacteria group bacterium]|nr:hypothetical protein [Patescibacteria group bacterium]